MDKLAPPTVNEKLLLPCLSDISKNLSDLNGPFSLTELKGVISHVKDSAPGMDGIPYSFVSHLSDESLVYYLNIINTIKFLAKFLLHGNLK